MAKNSSKVENAKGPSAAFIGMALEMSWRLAIVVLVPIIGGFYLDEAFNTTPLLVIVGFAVAMGGMYIVMRQTVQAANDLPVPTVIEPETKSKVKTTKEKKA